MSLIDIDIPFNNGSVGSITESTLHNNNGNGYCWVGGNNNNKFISVRLQSNPHFAHFHVFEVDDIKASAPVFTDLGGMTHSLSLDGDQQEHPIKMVRVNSTTAYMRLFTGGAASKHLVLEIDESDNSVVVTDVTPDDSNYQGGMTEYSQNYHKQGRAMYEEFMYPLKDNSIVMFARNYFAGYFFLQVDWDPATKTINQKIVLHGDGLNKSGSREVPNLTGQNLTVCTNATGSTKSMNTAANLVGTDSGRNDMHSNTYPYALDDTVMGQRNYGWIQTCESRDGNSIHFSLIGMRRNRTTSSMISMRDDMHDCYYVVTYKKDVNDWNITSRSTPTNIGNNISSNRGACWLPLNTVASSTLSSNTLVATQDHAVTWLSIGAHEMQVCGQETGGRLSIVDSNKLSTEDNASLPTSSSQALQTFWLNDDHFMVIWIPSGSYSYILTQNQTSADNYATHYSIIKYIDENVVEVVSHGPVTGRADSPDMSFADFMIFTKMDEFTFFSDKFARPITISAPE
jgi:hypothetical protein